MEPGARSYTLDDGRTIHVMVEVDLWSVWLDGDPRSQVLGWPLEDTIMGVLNLDVLDEVPAEIVRLAARIRDDFGDYGAPEPTT